MPRKAILTIVVIISTAVLSFAQTGLSEIVGIVYDSDMNRIPDAEITLTGPALIQNRVVHSGEDGSYRIFYLPPGRYSMLIRKENYRSKEIEDINVRAGRSASLIVKLDIGEFDDVTVIIQDRPLIDTRSTEKGLNIDSAFIERMPLNQNREWTMIYSLIPGAVTDNEFATATDAGGFKMGLHGASAEENVLVLDGMRMQNMTEHPPVYFTTSIIDDVEVVTSGFDARNQSGMGAYVNVVTKSGGDEFSGSASMIFQPKSWNWNNTDEGQAPEVGMYLPEVSIGGPIIKGKTWFFTSYLYDYRREGIYRDKDYLQLFEDLGFGTPDYDNERNSHRFFGKVTHAFNVNNQIALSVNWDRLEDFRGDMRSTVDRRQKNLSGGLFANLKYSTVINDNFTINFSAAYRKSDISVKPDGVLKTEITRFRDTVFYPFLGMRYGVGGTEVNYNGTGSETERESEMLEMRADANLYLDDVYGNHAVQFGFYYLPMQEFSEKIVSANPVTISEAMDANGNWVPFLITEYQNFDDAEEYKNQVIAGYIQDTWNPDDRLTISAGARIEKNMDDLEFINPVVISPHAGITYSLTDDHSQTVRFAFSRRQEMISLENIIRSVYVNVLSSASFKYDSDLDGVFENIMPFPAEPPVHNRPGGEIWVLGRKYLQDPDLKPAHVDMFHAGYTATLPYKMILDVSGIFNIFRDRIKNYVDYNFNWNSNGEITGLKQPDLADAVSLIANDKWSSERYWSLEVTLSKQFAERWQLIASYTTQDSKIVGEWSPYDPERYYFDDSWFEYSHAGELPRHIFRLAGSYSSPWGVVLSASISYRSSRLETPVYYEAYSADVPTWITLDDGQTLQHPFSKMQVYTQPRNSERDVFLDAATNVNIGIGKTFNWEKYTLDTQIQIFNLFNSGTHISGLDGGFDPMLNRRNSYYLTTQTPRAAQLMIRVGF